MSVEASAVALPMVTSARSRAYSAPEKSVAVTAVTASAGTSYSVWSFTQWNYPRHPLWQVPELGVTVMVANAETDVAATATRVKKVCKVFVIRIEVNE